jgi:hypothetical protein
MFSLQALQEWLKMPVLRLHLLHCSLQ